MLELNIFTDRMKQKYNLPDNPNKSILSKSFIALRVFIACFIPLVNAVFFYIMMFKNDEMEEIWERCVVLNLKKKEEADQL